MIDNNSGRNEIEQFDERYRIITKLESGGMADIYLGVQLGSEGAFERLVVIKKIRARGPEAKQAMGMFLDEARVVASLNHPHIVKIYDLSRVKNSICITMEYIDGENLDFILKWLKNRDQELPLSITCRLMIQACEALHYAHTATHSEGYKLNIIHRDIDLRNLMLDSNGYLKVIDFGVAKASTQVEITSPTMFKGKLSYIAPETFNEKDIDHRADIYALGLVFYQLATGVNPFPFKKDANLGEVIHRICNEIVTDPSEINKSLPVEINELIAKAIHKDRGNRFPTALDFGRAIREFSNSNEGIAGTNEVKEWFNEQFEERHKHRRKYEQTAMRKARELVKKAALLQTASSIPPPPHSIPMKNSGPLPPVPIPSTAPYGGSASYPYTPDTSGRVSSIPPGIPGSQSSIPPHPGSYSSLSGMQSRAMTPGSEYYPDNSLYPPSGSYPGAMPPSQTSQGPMIGPLPPRQANPYMMMLIAFLLFASAAILVHQLFFDPGRKAGDVPGDNNTAEFNVVVYSDQENSEVFLDSEAAGTTGKKGLRLWVKPEEIHNLSIIKEGYEPYKVAFWAKKESVHQTDAILNKKVTMAMLEKEQDESEVETAKDDSSESEKSSSSKTWLNRSRHTSKSDRSKEGTEEQSSQESEKENTFTSPKEIEGGSPEKTDTESAAKPTAEQKMIPVEPKKKPVVKPPSNPWYSGDGNWSGAEVAKRGCTKCHKSGIDLRSRTTEEWVSFFRRKQHSRSADLDRYFSPKEQVRVLRYLLKKLQNTQ